MVKSGVIKSYPVFYGTQFHLSVHFVATFSKKEHYKEHYYLKLIATHLLTIETSQERLAKLEQCGDIEKEMSELEMKIEKELEEKRTKVRGPFAKFVSHPLVL